MHVCYYMNIDKTNKQHNNDNNNNNNDIHIITLSVEARTFTVQLFVHFAMTLARLVPLCVYIYICTYDIL